MMRAIVAPPAVVSAALSELKAWLGISRTADDGELASLMRARDAGKAFENETVSVVRISLKGKTRDQIHSEIRVAAQTVCKAQPRFTVVSYQACVTDTVRAAKAQLQARIGAAA